MAENRAYLDWNASAPLLPEARGAMLGALENCGNPSSVHREGRAARAELETARRSVAGLIGVGPEQVVFTSGATEAACAVLTPHWEREREPHLFSRLYVCAADHPCTLAGGQFSAAQVVRLPVDASGLLDLAVLRETLAKHDSPEGRPLVAVHAANNETGVVQPWDAIGRIVREAEGVFVLDAVQAVGRLLLEDVLKHADCVLLSAHKIGGSKGAGAFATRLRSAMPRQFLRGGGQERGLRAGTENIPALAGFGAAAEAAVRRLSLMRGVEALRDRFEALVLERWPDAVIHGLGSPRLPNTSFFTLPGIKAETAQMAFDLAGVALSAGSACSSGKVGPSHILKAMGFDGGEGAIRVSIGPETGEREFAAFAGALEKVGRRARPPAQAA